MHIRKFTGRAAVSAALGISLLGFGPSASAADSSTQLPISSHEDIVVDGVHRHVFISDPASGSVVVTGYDGTVVKQIDGEPGASGLALSADSGTLYVALRTADAISAIDTATLQETARYSTGAGTAPQYPAIAGGKVWFGYGGEPWGGIGYVDLSGPDPVIHAPSGGGRTFASAPILASSPGNPGLLVAGDASVSPPVLAVYDVSTGDERQTAHTSISGGSVADLAVTPDGKDVVVASGAPYYHQSYSTSDLSPSNRYTTGAYPNAVAITPDGSTLAAGLYAPYDPDVYLFQPSVDTQLKNYDFPSTSTDTTTLQEAGLAWAPDGSRLFALTKTYGLSTLTLRVLDQRVESTLTLQAPESVRQGKKVTVSGTLSASAPFPAGTEVDVTRYDDAHPEQGVSLGSHSVADDGTFKFTDIADTAGWVGYGVHYAGDARHTEARALVNIRVS
ncbi:YncE family protein [Streptomyces cupreus]|uniref:Ig-like domain repeat protein n=1 Tax=Streptomyces cupreus TaxID=2759956 RepID=A0A7X1JA71_9ACTN|nr:hypothetical protein [Streptomyces cupreus]MBC2906991.1 hypothetical protein [Streptomyces cupreus]